MCIYIGVQYVVRFTPPKDLHQRCQDPSFRLGCRGTIGWLFLLEKLGGGVERTAATNRLAPHRTATCSLQLALLIRSRQNHVASSSDRMWEFWLSAGRCRQPSTMQQLYRWQVFAPLSLARSCRNGWHDTQLILPPIGMQHESRAEVGRVDAEKSSLDVQS